MKRLMEVQDYFSLNSTSKSDEFAPQVLYDIIEAYLSFYSTSKWH